MGGSSAFGAKAGDVFTRITVVTAAIWILISLIALLWANHRGDILGTTSPSSPADSALDVLPQAKEDKKVEQPTEPQADATDAAPISPPTSKDAATTNEK
jgi:preprotein translocase subunit SecG